MKSFWVPVPLLKTEYFLKKLEIELLLADTGEMELPISFQSEICICWLRLLITHTMEWGDALPSPAVGQLKGLEAGHHVIQPHSTMPQQNKAQPWPLHFSDWPVQLVWAHPYVSSNTPGRGVKCEGPCRGLTSKVHIVFSDLSSQWLMPDLKIIVVSVCTSYEHCDSQAVENGRRC